MGQLDKINACAGGRRVRGKVVQLAGPWRTSGDWWDCDEWARDEWDVELSDGGIYRIYRDLKSSLWFIEGAYD
jgi:protein ImuB